jgi:hypothetical protein
MPPIDCMYEDAIVHVKLSGRYSFEEALEAIEGVVVDERFEKGMNLLLDVIDSEETRTSYQMEELAARIGAMRISLGKRVALCARRAHHYGLARMHSAFGQRYGMEYGVFVGVNDAKAWLREKK